MSTTSNLVFYSIGYVAKDLAPGGTIIDIYPAETVPMSTGDPTKPNIIPVNSTDVNGKHTLTKATQQAVITAAWAALGASNQLGAPLVCAGERVMILRYGDTDRFYWVTYNTEIDLRKRDIYTIFVSSKPGSDPVGFMDKGYFFTMDAVNKVVNLHTSTADGENTGYDLYIDTKEGYVVLTDSNGTGFKLDSPSKTFTINTGNIVNINTQTANINAAVAANITAPNITLKGAVNIN